MKKRNYILAAALVFVLVGCCSRNAMKAKPPEDANIANLHELDVTLRMAEGERPNFLNSFEEVARIMPPETMRPEIFVSPDTGHRPGSLNSVKSWTDYIYVGGVDDYATGVALVISPPENHGGKWGYVIWVSGVISRLPAEKIRQLIADPFCMDTNTPADNLAFSKRLVTIQVPARFSRQYEDANLARLNELGAVLRLLAGARFPSSLQLVAEAMPPETLNPEIFVVPGSGHKTGTLNAVGAWTDFIYVSGLDNGLHSGVPLVISPPENHGGKCGYVIWTDGGTAKLPAQKTRELIADPFCMTPFAVEADQKKRMQLQIPERLKRYYASAEAKDGVK